MYFPYRKKNISVFSHSVYIVHIMGSISRNTSLKYDIEVPLMSRCEMFIIIKCRDSLIPCDSVIKPKLYLSKYVVQLVEVFNINNVTGNL